MKYYGPFKVVTYDATPTHRPQAVILINGNVIHCEFADTPDEAEAAALTWIRDTCTATLTALGDAS